MGNTWRMRNIRWAHRWLIHCKIAIKEMAAEWCWLIQASGNVNYNFPFTLLFNFPLASPGCSAQLKVH